MKRLIELSLATATLALLATSANAAVTLSPTSVPFQLTAPHEVVTFDAANATGYTFVGSTAGLIYNGADGLHPNVAAPPFGDTSLYMAIMHDQSATLDIPAIKSLSIYIGSLDPTNKITFNGAGSFTQSFEGSDLFTPAQGNQSNDLNNRRFTFSFSPSDGVNQIVFSSGEDSFEFDNIALGVPEPGTWAMMLLGFGGIGFMLRASKRREMGIKALV